MPGVPGVCRATQQGAGTSHSRMDGRTDGLQGGGLPTCISLSFQGYYFEIPSIGAIRINTQVRQGAGTWQQAEPPSPGTPKCCTAPKCWRRA